MAHPKLHDRKSSPVAHPDKHIIRGKIPSRQSLEYERSTLLQVNVVLGFCLFIVLIMCMVSYVLVVSREIKVKELHSSANKINYENIELQNKVDQLKSFYVLDNKVHKMDFLKKPDQVIEVKSNGQKPVVVEDKKKIDVTPVSGF